jgi:hypothetical protein
MFDCVGNFLINDGTPRVKAQINYNTYTTTQSSALPAEFWSCCFSEEFLWQD